MFWLALLFFVVPIAELAVILQVADWAGIPLTIIGLIVISLVGGWLVKREGVGVWRRLQNQLQRGQLPRTEVVDGFLVMFAGALLLTPGFLTDILAALLLLPPTRALIRPVVLRWWAKRRSVAARRFVVVGRPDNGGDVIDVDSEEYDPSPRSSRELGAR
jgi:UPF0716 protein FxsA